MTLSNLPDWKPEGKEGLAFQRQNIEKEKSTLIAKIVVQLIDYFQFKVNL